MARSIWSGVISFGLVSVPVGLFSATREHEVTFHQFEKGTKDRIRYQRVNERTGTEVDYGDIVKGAEVRDGTYVMLDQDELDSVASGRSRSVDIHVFVDLDEVDPIYFQKTYYLAPGSDETVRTYALLRDAMAKANRVAIGTMVMRGKEHLAAIRADGDLLVLETMFFADEIRDPGKELSRVPGQPKLRPQELTTAGQLIDSMSGPWTPTDFRDSYQDRVRDLIKAKSKGAEITVAEEAPEATNVIDIMDALRASVEVAQQGRTGGRRRQPGSGSRSAAGSRSSSSTRTSKRGSTAPASKSTKAKTATTAKATPVKKATRKATKTTKTATTAGRKTARTPAKKAS